MNKTDIITKLTDILTNEFEIDEAKMVPQAKLKSDLGLDSLDMVDVVVLIDEHFGIKLTSKDFKDIKTYSEFYDLLDKRING